MSEYQLRLRTRNATNTDKWSRWMDWPGQSENITLLLDNGWEKLRLVDPLFHVEYRKKKS